MAAKKVPSVSSTSLSMTLPISCQICLGKVREPVVCPNQHVFCSTCMDMWLRTHSFCPTCRTSITTEKPCKKILGSIDLPVNSDAVTRAELRRTRLELIRREYEDELKSLQSTVERLKSENKQLHEKMIERERTMASMDFSQRHHSKDEDSAKLDIDMLVKLTTRLQEASHTYENLRSDMDKIKEENKKLLDDNKNLARENSRLKDNPQFSKSPQRYSHYTMAGLQTKVGQYEREVQQLRRALLRSDSFIDDLTNKLDRGGTAGQPSSKRAHLRTSPAPSSCTITSMSNDRQEGAETATSVGSHAGADVHNYDDADAVVEVSPVDGNSQKKKLPTAGDSENISSNSCPSPILPPVGSERFALETPSNTVRDERTSVFSSRRSSDVSVYGQDLDIPPGPLTSSLNVLEPVEGESLDRPPSRGELLLLGDPSSKQEKPALQENLNMFTASRQLMMLSERRFRQREGFESGKGREVGSSSPTSSDGGKRKSLDSKSLEFDVFSSAAVENPPSNEASQDSPPSFSRDDSSNDASPSLRTFSLAKIKAEIEGTHENGCPLKRPKLENEFLEDVENNEQETKS